VENVAHAATPEGMMTRAINAGVIKFIEHAMAVRRKYGMMQEKKDRRFWPHPRRRRRYSANTEAGANVGEEPKLHRRKNVPFSRSK
jgi:hypothetical protein